jgi:hypothetical protein
MADGRSFSDVIEGTALNTFLDTFDDEMDDESDRLLELDDADEGKGIDEKTFGDALLTKVPIVDADAGEFAGYFKAEHEKDPSFTKHRGTKTGIPEDAPGFGNRSIAMFKLDRLLGADLVPPTFRASHDAKSGIIMQKVVGTAAQDAKGDLEIPAVQRAFSNLSLLDYIAGQVDRHQGNYLLVRANGGPITGIQAIDNDLAFGENYMETVEGMAADLEQIREANPKWHADGMRVVTHGVLPKFVTGIDKPFAEKIIALGRLPDLIDDALYQLLTPSEITATKNRLAALAGFLQPLIDNDDDVIRTQWA